MVNAKELNWYFTEFLKALIALSLTAKKQFEVYGDGDIGKEMMEDFKSNFSEHKDEFVNSKQILAEHKIELEKLESTLYAQNEEFYNEPKLLYSSKKWEEIRAIAGNCLNLMKLDHLSLESTIINEESVDEEGDEVIFQIIQIEIVDKRNPDLK